MRRIKPDVGYVSATADAAFEGFAEDAMHADVGVLQVGGGVAFEGKHAIPFEDVIADAVFGEVRIFDGSDADRMGDAMLKCRRKRGILLGDDCRGALLGFVEQVFELHRVAAAGFEGFSVGAEHGAKRGMLE